MIGGLNPPMLAEAETVENPNKVVFDQPISLEFTQWMNKRSVQEAFSISPEIPGHFEWANRKTLEFHPDKPLRIGSEYQISLRETAKSIGFKPMREEVILNFIAVGPAQILYQNPGDGGVLSLDKGITIMFDQPMALDQINPRNLLKIEPSLEGEIKLRGESAFQFFPKALEKETEYQLQVPAGLPTKNGEETRQATTWEVKVPKNAVLSSNPLPNQTIDLNQTLEIDFSEPIDLNLVQPGENVELFPSNDLQEAQNDGFFNTEIRHATDSNGEEILNRLIFKPTFPFKKDQIYEFVLKKSPGFELEEDFHLKFRATARSQETEKADVGPLFWPNNLYQTDGSSLSFLINKVKFKGGEELEILGKGASAGAEIELEITDYTEEIVSQTTLKTDENGTFYGKMALPETVGRYEIRLKNSQGQINAEAFPVFVEDDQTIRIDWIEEKERSTPEFRVEATYANGLPALGLTGQYQIYQKPYQPEYQDGNAQFKFVSSESPCLESCETWKLLKEGPLTVNAQGQASLPLSDEEKATFWSKDHEFVFQAQGILENGEIVRAQKHFIYPSSSFSLGLATEKQTLSPGESLQAKVVALTSAGELLENVTVNLSLSEAQNPSEALLERTVQTTSTPEIIDLELNEEVLGEINFSKTYLLKAEAQDDIRPLTTTQTIVISPSTESLSENGAGQTLNTEINLDPVKPKAGERVALELTTRTDTNERLPAQLALNVLSDQTSIYFEKFQTDERGRVTAYFQMPEDVGKVHIQVLAWDGAGKQGFDEKQLDGGQKLSLQPLLPNVVTPGDEVDFKVKVRNEVNEPVSSKIQLEEGQLEADSTVQSVNLEAGQEKILTFKVKIDPTVDKKALEVAFILEETTIKQIITLHSEQTVIPVLKNRKFNSAASDSFSLSEDVSSSLGRIVFNLSDSPQIFAKNLEKELQNITSNTPYILALKLLTETKIPDSERQKQARQQKVDHLLKIKSEEGSYGWWKEGPGSAKVTALVALALSKAQEDGIQVEKESLQKTLLYLLDQLKNPNLPIAERIFVAWVLSENEQYDTEQTLLLFKELEAQDFMSQTFLWMTLENLHQAGQTSVKPFIDRLKKELASEVAKNQDGWFFESPQNSPRLTTAVVLYALARFSPDNPLYTPLKNYLTAQTIDYKKEFNPEETLWLSLAFQELQEVQPINDMRGDLEIRVNEAISRASDVSYSGSSNLSISPTVLKKTEPNSILVKKNPQQETYLQAQWEAQMIPEKSQPIEKKALLVETIYKADDPEKTTVQELKASETYVRHLFFILPQDVSALNLTIPQAAGLQMPLNTPPAPFDHLEIRPEALKVFTPFLSAGVYEVELPLRPVLPSQFQQLPLKLSSYADPDLRAQTKTQRITVTQ